MNEMLEKIGQNQDSQAQNFEQDFVFFDPELKWYVKFRFLLTFGCFPLSQ